VHFGYHVCYLACGGYRVKLLSGIIFRYFSLFGVGSEISAALFRATGCPPAVLLIAHSLRARDSRRPLYALITADSAANGVTGGAGLKSQERGGRRRKKKKKLLSLLRTRRCATPGRTLHGPLAHFSSRRAFRAIFTQGGLGGLVGRAHRSTFHSGRRTAGFIRLYSTVRKARRPQTRCGRHLARNQIALDI